MLPRVLAPLLLTASHLLAQAILPAPVAPAENPQTPEKALLGKALFWDEQLSSSRSVACGTCHVFSQGGADPRTQTAAHPGPDGVFGTPDDTRGSPGVGLHDTSGHYAASLRFGVQVQVTPRRAPSVINAAYAQSLFLDGRAGGQFLDPVTGAVVIADGGALESQIASPPVNSAEMGHLGRTWTDIAADLSGLTPLVLAANVPATLQQFVAGRTYDTLFTQVFGSPGVTPVRIIFALAAYERTLISDQSPFDRFLAGRGSLTASQQAGLTVFDSHCATCHTDLNASVLVTGPALDDYRNIGERPTAEDRGRAAITGLAADRGAFRVPGLRNVALRGSYFHRGRQPTLGAVLDFYRRGGDFADNRDPLVANLQGNLTGTDSIHVLALLQSLTDPRVANELPPFDRPTLWSEGAMVPYSFGTGSAGVGREPPRIAAMAPAYLGNPRFAIGVDRVPAGSLGILLLDWALAPVPVQLGGHTLFLELTPQALLLPIAVAAPGPDGAGHTSALFAIPQVPALAGTYFAQWIAFDPEGPWGLASSNALAFTIF